MRGSRHSTLSRSACLVLVLFLASLIALSPPTSGHHLEIAGVEAFIRVTGNATPGGDLFFDKMEIILGPTPVFVNVTFTNEDFTSNQNHNFTTVLEDVFYETPLLSPGETGWVEFWINETGRFPYWCAVGQGTSASHRDAGMEGFFIVTDTGELGVRAPPPSGIEIRAYWIGLIGMFAMIGVIIVSYFVIKYESRHHTDQREHRRRGLP